MSDSVMLLVLLIVGLVAGLVGSLVSGTLSLISLTAMLSLGLPAPLAMATYTSGAFAWRLGGLKEFIQQKKVIWNLVPPLALAGLLGSSIGSRLLLEVNTRQVELITGIALLIFIPLLLFNKNLGLERGVTSKRRKTLGICVYFLVSIWAGFFAAGTGMLFLLIYLWLFKLPVLELKATDKIPGMFLDLGTLIVMISHQVIQPALSLAFMTGMYIGSWAGVHLSLKIGNAWLRTGVIIAIGLAAIRLIV